MFEFHSAIRCLYEGKDLADFVGDLRACRQQTKICINPGRLFVEVTGPNVRLADPLLNLVSGNQAQLRMHFEIGNTKADMHPGIRQ